MHSLQFSAEMNTRESKTTFIIFLTNYNYKDRLLIKKIFDDLKMFVL